MENNPNAAKQFDRQETDRELQHLRAKVEALSSLMRISIIINSTLDLDELLGLVMEKAQSVMNSEASSVMIIDQEKNVLICPVALGEVGEKIKKIELPMDKGIAGWVATTGEAQIIPDAYQDPRFNPKVDEETGFKTQSILAAPLKVKDKIIGVAEVINRVDGQAFNEDDLELFSAFCRQVAMAVENARIHQLELEKQRIEQQLETAKFIQQSFMPSTYPTSPEKKFEVAAKNISAASVGGDFYDFIEFQNGNVGFTIGDVSGKGIPAALFMARIVSDFHLYASHYSNPAKVMETLNQILIEHTKRGMFVTSIYGILDVSKNTFTYADAGHLPVIRTGLRREQVDLFTGSRGVPLGVVPKFNFATETIELQKGDYLILISDGVIEAKSDSGEMYSLERLTDLLTPPAGSAQELLDFILKDVQKFSGKGVQHDDLTIVVIKWG